MDESFGRKFRRLRVSTTNPDTGYKFTQNDMALMFSVTVMAIKHWEADRRRPGGPVMVMLSKLWPDDFPRKGVLYEQRISQ